MNLERIGVLAGLLLVSLWISCGKPANVPNYKDEVGKKVYYDNWVECEKDLQDCVDSCDELLY